MVQGFNYYGRDLLKGTKVDDLIVERKKKRRADVKSKLQLRREAEAAALKRDREFVVAKEGHECKIPANVYVTKAWYGNEKTPWVTQITARDGGGDLVTERVRELLEYSVDGMGPVGATNANFGVYPAKGVKTAKLLIIKVS